MVPTTKKGTLSRKRIPSLNPRASFWPSGELSMAVRHIAHCAKAASEATSKIARAAKVSNVHFAHLDFFLLGCRSFGRTRKAQSCRERSAALCSRFDI
jgi:hypothetical protein